MFNTRWELLKNSLNFKQTNLLLKQVSNVESKQVETVFKRGMIILAQHFNDLLKTTEIAANRCSCNCNFTTKPTCTCNCDYCPCNCNYCTCNCNYGCTCNCNY